MRTKTVTFRHRWLPYALIAPQIVITAVFFMWPASQAIWQSLLREDAFGLKTEFVGFDQLRARFSPTTSISRVSRRRSIFSALVAGISMGVALLLAAMADRVIRRATAYRTLLIWPYAVAPAVAGVLWWFLFNPTIGIAAYGARRARLRLEPLRQREQRDRAYRHCRRLAAGELQLPVLPRRASGDPANR